MPKLTLIAILLFCCCSVHAQNDFFAFKKWNKVITIFSKDDYIAFQLKDHQWYAGYVKKVQHDSFYFMPVAIIYSFMHSDTLRYNIMRIALADVFSMPKEGIQIDFMNGRFDVRRSGGHVHWYWVKGGWLFRTGGAGYAMLNITNNLIQKNAPFAAKNIGTPGICAGLFAVGMLLKETYKPYLVLGRKYHLQYE